MGTFIVSVTGRNNQTGGYYLQKLCGYSAVINAVKVFWDSDGNAILGINTNVSSQSRINILLVGFIGTIEAYSDFTPIDETIYSNSSSTII